MIYTSFFANKNLPSHLEKISIARITPTWFNPDGFFLELAPSEELLFSYKNEQINELQYEIEYQKQLDKLDPIQIQHKLNNKVLLCYESNDNFCHRHLLSSWLNKNNVPTIEYKKDVYHIEFYHNAADIDCSNQANKIFVHYSTLEGDELFLKDNLKDCTNLFNLPIRTYSDAHNSRDSFLFDNLHYDIIINKLRLLYIYLQKGYIIVFPVDEYGKGQSKMQQYAPKIFYKAQKILDEFFFIHKTKSIQKTLF